MTLFVACELNYRYVEIRTNKAVGEKNPFTAPNVPPTKTPLTALEVSYL